MDFSLTVDPQASTTRVEVVTPRIDEDVQRLQAFVANLGATPSLRRIVGTRADSAQLLSIGEITRFYTSDKKVFAAARGSEWRVKTTMSELSKMLPAREFIRINQGEIVSLSAVKSLDFSLAGSIGLTMVDGTRCFVSRRCLRDFRAALNL